MGELPLPVPWPKEATQPKKKDGVKASFQRLRIVHIPPNFVRFARMSDDPGAVFLQLASPNELHLPVFIFGPVE